MRVFVEQFPNKDLREFHLSIPVVAKPYDKYGPNAKTPKGIQRLERMLDALPQVGGSTVGLSGRVERKSIRVEINKAYTWDEVTEAVVGVLEKFFKEKVEYTLGEREEWMDRPHNADSD